MPASAVGAIQPITLIGFHNTARAAPAKLCATRARQDSDGTQSRSQVRWFPTVPITEGFY
jgi:hypothetical protein